MGSNARHYGYPGTKFGSSLEAPVWMPSGSAILVWRVAMEGPDRRTRLWKIDLADGELLPLGAGDACDVLKCAVDAPSSRIVLLEQCDELLRASLVHPVNGTAALLRSLSAAKPRLFQYAKEHLYLPLENATAATEVVAVPLDERKAEQTLTSVNSNVQPGTIKVMTVKWTASGGRQIFAP